MACQKCAERRRIALQKAKELAEKLNIRRPASPRNNRSVKP